MSKIILAISLVVLCGLVFITEGSELGIDLELAPKPKRGITIGLNLGGPGDPCQTNSDCDQEEFLQFCGFVADDDGNFGGMVCLKVDP